MKNKYTKVLVITASIILFIVLLFIARASGVTAGKQAMMERIYESSVMTAKSICESSNYIVYYQEWDEGCLVSGQDPECQVISSDIAFAASEKKAYGDRLCEEMSRIYEDRDASDLEYFYDWSVL